MPGLVGERRVKRGGGGAGDEREAEQEEGDEWEAAAEGEHRRCWLMRGGGREGWVPRGALRRRAREKNKCW